MSQPITDASLDTCGLGLVSNPLNPLRYDGQPEEPWEASGILRSLMPEKVRVLDVGCGPGSITAIVNAAKSNEVLGVEPDTTRANVARSRGLNVVCGILTEELIEAQGAFDVVMLADVLEHLTSPDDMLRLALLALKPNGSILVSVPNVAHWSVRLKLLFGRFDYAQTGICDSTHLRWFTQKTIRQLLCRHDLDIVSMRSSIGGFLGAYQTKPLKYIPKGLRRRVLQSLTATFPRLFACQFIIMARKGRPGSDPRSQGV